MYGETWIKDMKTASIMEAEIYINRCAVVHQFVHQLERNLIFDFTLLILKNPYFSDYITLYDTG